MLYVYGNSKSGLTVYQVKEVGTKLGATVIMVDTEDTGAAMEIRDKCIFKAMNESYRRPEGAFNLIEGDQPDFVFLHRQLLKALLVFTGDFLKEEGTPTTSTTQFSLQLFCLSSSFNLFRSSPYCHFTFCSPARVFLYLPGFIHSLPPLQLT